MDPQLQIIHTLMLISLEMITLEDSLVALPMQLLLIVHFLMGQLRQVIMLPALLGIVIMQTLLIHLPQELSLVLQHQLMVLLEILFQDHWKMFIGLITAEMLQIVTLLAMLIAMTPARLQARANFMFRLIQFSMALIPGTLLIFGSKTLERFPP